METSIAVSRRRPRNDDQPPVPVFCGTGGFFAGWTPRRLQPKHSRLGTLMYTLHMSWLFRMLALTIVLALGVTSQAGCLMPDQPDAQSLPDCCKQMAPDCPTNTSMACCRTAFRTAPAVAITIARNFMQQFVVAERAVDPASPPMMVSAERLFRGDREPPSDIGVSSLVLRI
jgi:hypothetical protein